MLYRLGLDAPSRTFDTAIAARLTGAARYGYASLVAVRFGVTLPKGLQTANWARRPLPPELARYARNDTRFLQPLAERFERRLTERGRIAYSKSLIISSLRGSGANPALTPRRDRNVSITRIGRWFDSVRRRGHARGAARRVSSRAIRDQSRSANTGAWSDAVWPSFFLRYSRSISTWRTRDTTAGVPSSRSMRNPRPRWKEPPR